MYSQKISLYKLTDSSEQRNTRFPNRKRAKYIGFSHISKALSKTNSEFNTIYKQLKLNIFLKNNQKKNYQSQCRTTAVQ